MRLMEDGRPIMKTKVEVMHINYWITMSMIPVFSILLAYASSTNDIQVYLVSLIGLVFNSVFLGYVVGKLINE